MIDRQLLLELYEKQRRHIDYFFDKISRSNNKQDIVDYLERCYSV